MMYQRIERPPSPVATAVADAVRRAPPSAPAAKFTVHHVPAAHALARMTDSGHAASGAPLQLVRKYPKDSDIRALIKTAAKNAQPNRTAILLEVYNEMRFEVDPTPIAFTTVLAGRNAMIAANRIDAGDADALDAEATRMQQAGGDPAEAMRLRITEKIAARHNAVEATYAQHIFQGDTKVGVPTGFHSIADGSATHEQYGAATAVGNVSAGGNASYQQSVRLTANQVRKPIQSTFFPDAATHGEVIDAIASVYEAGLSVVGYVAPSVNGLKLAKKGDTVFPAGGLDTRLAQ
jgi:hypothetical protein